VATLRRAIVVGILFAAIPGCRTRLDESAVDMSPLFDLSPAPDLATCIGVDPTGAPTVIGMDVAENPPMAMGGTVTPGKYFWESWISYTGPGGVQGGATSPNGIVFEFGDGTFHEAQLASLTEWENHSGKFSTADTTMTVTYDCPGQATRHYPYTATPTQLVWILAPDLNAQVQVYSFTRQ
jgi:hypothetical protein